MLTNFNHIWNWHFEGDNDVKKDVETMFAFIAHFHFKMSDLTRHEKEILLAKNNNNNNNNKNKNDQGRTPLRSFFLINVFYF